MNQTLQSNYHGTLLATRTLLPLIRPGGRLVNVASIVGNLNTKYSPALRQQFASSETVEDVTTLMDSFTRAVKAGKEKEDGWPSAAYAVSKTGTLPFPPSPPPSPRYGLSFPKCISIHV